MTPENVPVTDRPGRPRHARRDALVRWVAAISVALVLDACGLSTPAGAPTGRNAADSTAAIVKGGTIYYAHDLEPPCLTGGWVEENYIERQFTDSLVEMTRGGSFVPWLARSWSTNPGRTVYTFHLKRNVTFTDGEPLNAAAVVANFDYWVDPKGSDSDTEIYLAPVFKSARAVNNLTVRVALTKPYDGFLAAISQSYAGLLAPATLKAGASAECDHPIGTGAWILRHWAHGKNLTFVRNPGYDSAPANAANQGPAYAAKLVWSFIQDPTTRWGALESNQEDVIEDVPTIDYPSARRDYRFESYITPGRPQTLELNADHGVFTKLRVRQAFAYAANRRAATRSAFNGEVPYDGNGALSPSTPDYDAALDNAQAYNPATARRLLERAGWTGHDAQGYRTNARGQELTVRLIYGSGSILNDEGATLLQDLQQEWKAVGFHVVLHPETLTELFGGQTPKTYDATIGYWTSPTPAVLYIVFADWQQNANNNTFYDNPTLTRDIQAANAALTPAEQKTDYDKAQQLIVNQAVDIGIYTKTTTLAVNKRLEGVEIEASQGDPVFSDAHFTKR